MAGTEMPQGQGDYTRDAMNFRRAMLATQSFTGKAVLTLVLYMIFWIPGLIANILFLKEANRIQAETGVAPAGKGCLQTLLAIVGAIAGIGILIFIIVAANS